MTCTLMLSLRGRLHILSQPSQLADRLPHGRLMVAYTYCLSLATLQTGCLLCFYQFGFDGLFYFLVLLSNELALFHFPDGSLVPCC